MKAIYLLIFSLISFPGFGQEKEVFIIGTMHTVPNLVKNSYRPLLKIARKYQPEAIYVESVRPEDTVSLNRKHKGFVAESDSLAQIFVQDDQRFAMLRNTDLDQFTSDDFEFMAKTYFVHKDNANYFYYDYLATYGLSGSEMPLRHEDSDLTSRLAIAMEMTFLYSMDDQQGYDEYHAAWEKCLEAGVDNGDNDLNNKISRKIFSGAVIPALFGRLGKHSNRKKSLNRYHLINSFRYVQNSTCDCDDGTTYWDERNGRMAQHIAEQIAAEPHVKNIVIVGAGHVVGIKEALEENYPELTVKVMYE